MMEVAVGISQSFQQLIVDLDQEIRRGLEEFFGYMDPEIRIDRKIKVMYGSGMISREAYFQLQEKLRQGQIGWGDVQIIYKEAVKRLKKEGKPRRAPADPDIARGLEQVSLIRARLEDAQAEAERTLAALDGSPVEAGRLAEGFARRARAALPDEAEARASLAFKHQFEERAAVLEERLHSLRAGLARIQALHSELDTYESDLRLLESEERLRRIEAEIRESLSV